MKEYFSILRNCPLFIGISDDNLSDILGCLGAKVVSFDKQENIFCEGDEPKYIGIILSGMVQIEYVDYFGNRTILTSIEPSDLFGEAFACADIEALPVNVVASEDTRVMLIDCSKVIGSCGNACSFHRQMIYNLMKILARKNLAFYEKIEMMTKRTTREKLMAYLLSQAKKTNSTTFKIPYDRQELADYLGIERSGLSVEISKLRREGIIVNRRKDFTIFPH